MQTTAICLKVPLIFEVNDKIKFETSKFLKSNISFYILPVFELFRKYLVLLVFEFAFQISFSEYIVCYYRILNNISNNKEQGKHWYTEGNIFALSKKIADSTLNKQKDEWKYVVNCKSIMLTILKAVSPNFFLFKAL